MNKRPVVISLYTGAGGLDLGLEAAGFRTGVAVEFDHWCAKTIQANRARWNVIEDDIHAVSSRRILKTAGLRKREAALVAGGPPCQPFSKSGYWASGDSRRLDDPRADTLTAFMRVVRDTLPRAFLLENVYGLVYEGKDEGLRHLLQLVEQINRETRSNYVVNWQVLNAADHGVPQIRERAFLIGSRDGVHFQFPRRTFADPGEEFEMFPLPPHRTAWDALGDLAEPTRAELEMRGAWRELLPSIPEGENYLWHTDRRGGLPLFGWRTRFWSFLLKLAKNRPAWTIQATPGPAIGPFHWSNRRLSPRELMRLQTFPDNFNVSGPLTEIQRQIGNAVPSLLAEVLGREIRRQLLGETRISLGPKLLPPDRSPVPPAEEVQPVPESFHHLVGKHEPHPGTGRGPKAVAAS
jgi:DNA (cytosine-5)-methyltransferase 1